MSPVGRVATAVTAAAAALIAWGPPIPRLGLSLAGWPACALLIAHYEARTARRALLSGSVELEKRA